ncbi:MAG: pilus assembly protein TadG-related protein [Parasphingopyxis sp.]|uniref:pilus assembly protein TadG-related protein n=1 Tax=Parasphingopyxis sp. TaxID=1920299 RepID=UPI003F9F1F96
MRRDRRGNTLALTAAAMIPIAAMIGSGLDMSRAYMAQAKLQNACDAAALAARSEMTGAIFDSGAQAEGERFFDFNFPSTTMNAQNIVRTVAQSTSDSSTVEVTASADIPTSLMSIFGMAAIPINVSCDANQDHGNADIMLVLDVTGSMNCAVGYSSCWYTMSNSKIGRLRDGAVGLYNALSGGGAGTRIRYGFMPYSVTVNVARALDSAWIRDPAAYQRDTGLCVQKYSYYSGYYWDCTGNEYALEEVDHSTSWLASWRGYGSYSTNTGYGCIEERATIGRSGSPISISTDVSRDDIDAVSTSDAARQWAPYDTSAQEAEGSSACPRPARQLAEYASASSYESMVDTVTGYVGGATYHDVGLIWGARFLSSTGMFASSNPETYNGLPVSKHIVFMTDGIISTSGSTYSAYGVDDEDDRVDSTLGLNAQHVARFQSACSRAKSMGITIWVIALDVADTSDIEPCATSSGHFETSDGTDLEDVFERIGAGIGRLRLTR